MSWLYPITHNIPWFIRTPAIALLGPECYTHLIYDLQLDHLICLKLGISRALSLAIVLGSGIVKIPQIFKILKSKSARGLSLSSFLLDTLGLIIIVGYNYRHDFPISTYGESFLLFIQNLIIIALIISLSNQSNSRILSILSLILPVTILTILLIPNSPISLTLLQTLLTLTIPLSLSSKVPQILINFQKKSTGQLSSFLIFSSFLGCLARLFTTFTETGDLTLLFNFGAGTLLNGILSLQMISYWKDSSSSNDSSYHQIHSSDSFELSHSTSISSSNTSPIKRFNSNLSNSPQPRINLNKPKQWTRKAD